MKMFVEPSDIYLHRPVVDFRKSINGLANIVVAEMNLNVMSGALFIESPRVHRRPVCLSQATLPDSFKLS